MQSPPPISSVAGSFFGRTLGRAQRWRARDDEAAPFGGTGAARPVDSSEEE